MLIKNCRILEPGAPGEAIDLLLEGGKIAGMGPGITGRGEDTIDAGGRIAAPGLIDVHVQGAGGSDTLDGGLGDLERISRSCARHGVTGFLATTVYRYRGENGHLKNATQSIGRDLGGARLLGIHLEGPFISGERRGMILPDSVCPPSTEVLEEILEITRGGLKIMTIAPELEGSMELIAMLRRSGVIASFGHSNASYEETLEGIEQGITHVTHLFNAMPSIHHRQPGPLLAILESEELSVQVIPDGVHVHPRVLAWALGQVGFERTISITDGMRSMDMPDGTYSYNGIEYHSKGGTARYRDGRLVGTSLCMDELLHRLSKYTGWDPRVAIATAAENPARLLGLGGKGRLSPGMDADIVIMEPDLSAWTTIVRGRTVYRSE